MSNLQQADDFTRSIRGDDVGQAAAGGPLGDRVFDEVLNPRLADRLVDAEVDGVADHQKLHERIDILTLRLSKGDSRARELGQGRAP